MVACSIFSITGNCYGADVSWLRHDHSLYPNGNTAIERFDPSAEQTLWCESEDSDGVEKIVRLISDIMH